MASVTLPDGSTIAFPEGMADADISSAVQSHLGAPQQMSGIGRIPAMVGSNLVKGVGEGLGAVGDLQDLIQRGVNPIADAAARGLGITPPQTPPAGLPTGQSNLSSSALTGYGRSAGIVDRPDLQPQNTGEKLLAAGVEGAGSMLPYAPLGAGSAIANVARGVVQGGAGGTLGETVSEMFPSHPDLARLGGNIAGALAGGKLFDAGNRIAGAVSGGSSPTLDAYRDLGIKPELAGDVTGSPLLQMTQAFAAKAPGGGAVHAASERAVGQWGRALEDTAANLGASGTLQDAGAALQTQGKGWLSQFKTASRDAWDAVDTHIPADAPVAVPNYFSTVNDIRRTIPTAKETAKVLGSPLSDALSGALTKDQWNTLVRSGQSPALNNTPILTWQDVKGIRTKIGERLDEPQLVGDTGHAELKRIYGALSGDLQNAAADHGPQAQAAFDQAATLTRNGHTFIDNVLSRVIKGDQIKPEDAAKTVLNTGASGGTTLQAVRDQMPGAADELAAFKLRNMALANAGQQNATASRLSPGTFVTDRANMSPEAIDALFGADPTAAKRLADLSTAAGSMKATERFLNTSNTGAHGAIGHAATGMAGMIPAAIEGYVHYGIPGALAAGVGAAGAPFLPGWLAAKATTSPGLAQLLAAPAAAPVSKGLLARSAVLPPALRGLASVLSGQPQ